MNYLKVIAIQNYGNSGTLFIQSLLDNHPQLIALPGLFAQQLLPFWERNSHQNTRALLDIFLQENKYWFEPETFKPLTLEHGLMHMGENKDSSIAIDKVQFQTLLTAFWLSKKFITRKEFVCSIYYAYNKVIGREYDENVWLVYPIHSLPKKYAQMLCDDFGKVYFLHMIRNPINLFGSLAKHINSHDYWSHCHLLECSAAQILNEYTVHSGSCSVYGRTPFFADTPQISSKGLKLETLHQDAKTSLTNLCQWLSIPWHDNLLQSTFNGMSWFNRPESIKQSGFNSKIIDQKYGNFMSNFDKLRVTCAAEHLLENFNYQLNSNTFNKILFPFSVWLPFAMEKNKSRKKQQRIDIKDKTKRELYKLKKNKVHLSDYFIWRIKKYFSSRTWLLKSFLNNFKRNHNEIYIKLLDK